MKTLIPMLLCLFALSTTTRSQCVVDFTYTNTQNDYHFQSTTNVLIDTADYIDWYFNGPHIMGSSRELSPSFHFPVNGMYIVSFQVGLQGCMPNYKVDSIIVSGITPTGTCNADFTYTPACCAQFQLSDQSIASDSIINYYWYAVTRDSFIQTWGTDTTEPLVSMWSYNCIYDYYYVTHAITTVTGCQSVTIDTIHTYCEACLGGMQADFTVSYESSTNTYSFHDASINNSNAGYWHWGFVSAGPFITSTEQNPVIVNSPYPIQIAFLEIQDTVVYCRQWKTDSIQQYLSVEEDPRMETRSLRAFQLSETSWRISSGLKGTFAFRLFDITGRRIFETTISPNSEWFDLELPAALSGVYIAQVQQREVAQPENC